MSENLLFAERSPRLCLLSQSGIHTFHVLRSDTLDPFQKTERDRAYL